MIRMQISVDEAVYERAKAVAKRRGISLAELVRRGLEETMAKEPQTHPWMTYAGAIDGSPQDSDTVDASSLALMKTHDIRQVWATDRHLGLAGALVLPRG